jgi:hypothetical protein
LAVQTRRLPGADQRSVLTALSGAARASSAFLAEFILDSYGNRQRRHVSRVLITTLVRATYVMTPFLLAVLQISLGGGIVFAPGILAGAA